MGVSRRATTAIVLVASIASAAAGTAVLSVPDWAAAADSQGGAEFSAEVAPLSVGDPISDAELQDLETIADQSDMSLQEAIDRYAWNDNFAVAVADIRDRYPDAFAGAEIVDADHAWIAFADHAPAEAIDIAGAFSKQHGDVAVDVRTNLGVTEAELTKATVEIHLAIYNMADVRDAATFYDLESGTITTTVVLDDDASASALDEARSVAATSLSNIVRNGVPGNLKADVIRSNSEVVGGNDSASYHMGGEDITGCTSGFGTRADSHTSGTRGISTAGHCDNPQTDDGSSLTYRRGHEGTHGDFQWHTGPKTENDNFYSGSSSATEVNSRDVSGIGFPATGQSLCKNGITNKKDCQEVRKLDVCHSGECHLIQMGARLAAGGDSGGPVFWGNTAYGLHKGWMYDPAWPFDRDLFSRASRIDNAIGVYIATN